MGIELIIKSVRKTLKLQFVTAYTQKELNDIFETPEFDVGSGLGIIMTTVSVTLMYSSTMPVLLPLCAANLSVYYMFQKYMLLRHNQKGPKLHPNVVIDQMETFSLILMLRLVLTIILLGETSAFFSTTAEGSIPIMTYFDNGVFNLFIGCCSQGHLRYHVGLLVAGGILVVLSNAKKIFVTQSTQDYVHHQYKTSAYSYPYEQTKDLPGNVVKTNFCPWYRKATKIVDENIYGESNLLSQKELKKGWFVEVVNRKNMTFTARRRYCRDVIDEEDGLEHKKGDVVRTWEHLKQKGLHSYRISKIPKYKKIFQGRMIQQTLSRKR